MSDEILATIYNAMDVFVLPTMGEGFGLPIIESQACRVPALATDFSSCSELVPEERCRLKLKGTLVMGPNCEQAIVDEGDIAGKLEGLYCDREAMVRLGQRCREFVKRFEWGGVCREFVKLVGEVNRPQPRF